jgi:PHD/YefM family antitoxin component YafN of YafNO toxin-antitoxin module
MRQLTLPEKNKDFINTLVDEAKQEPVTIRLDNGKEFVFLSKENYEFLTGDRQRRIENLLKARDALADEAAKNGLTEEILADILNEKPGLNED